MPSPFCNVLFQKGHKFDSPAFTIASPLHCVMSPSDSTRSASPILYQRALAEGILAALLLPKPWHC
jgi:hypothetical protein